MSLPAMLDVAIALIFLFLILSLIVTAVSELIAQLLRLRAKGLSGGISRLLDDENLLAAVKATGVYHLGAASNSKHGPSYLSGRNFALAVIEAVNRDKPVAEKLENVTATIEQLPEGKFRDALRTVTAAAAEETEAKLKAIGDYFDEAMARAGGVYKRWMQLWSLLIGTTLAVALNADAIQVAKETWRDDSLRAQIVAAAEETMAAKAEAGGSVQEMAQIADNLEALRPFPIGWSRDDDAPGQEPPHWLSRLIGWAITGFATMLGAPFWFDLLSKIMKVRSSIRTGAQSSGATT